MENIEIPLTIFTVQNEQVWVNSVDVAKYYGMQHKHLLKAIDNKLKRFPELKEYIKLSYYKNSQNKSHRCYRCYLIHKEHSSKFFPYGNKKKNRTESEYTKALQERVGGEREVKTDFGAIDLLTENTLYEVKQFNQYKTALGQLFAYGSLYPNHKLAVAFFDYSNVEEWFIDKVVRLFNANNIEVLFLEERKDVVIKHSKGFYFNQMNLFNN